MGNMPEAVQKLGLPQRGLGWRGAFASRNVADNIRKGRK